MIHVDANILVALSILLQPKPTEFERRLRKGESVIVSAPAWFEFACGPVTAADLDKAGEFLGGNVAPLTREHADRGGGALQCHRTAACVPDRLFDRGYRHYRWGGSGDA